MSSGVTVGVTLLACLAGAATAVAAQRLRAENVIVVTLDGLRWQEVFGGAAIELIDRTAGGVSDGSWHVLPYILNVRRSGVFANGDGPPMTEPRSDRERLLNEFAGDLPPYWGPVRFDAATMAGALEYFRTRRPRVFYVMLGETDEWAHERRYDLYLDAAWRADRFIRRLWERAQALGQYVGKTALIVTTDHGRGVTTADWTDHGRAVPAADRIWIAVLGPDTPALGVRDSVVVTQAQVAASVAALVGEDFTRAVPAAASPLPGVTTRGIGIRPRGSEARPQGAAPTVLRSRRPGP